MNNVSEEELMKELYAKIDFLCDITRTSLYDVEWYLGLEKEFLAMENRTLSELSIFNLSKISKLFEVTVDALLHDSMYEFSRKVRIAILKKEIKEMEEELDRELEEKRRLYKLRTGKDYVSKYST